MLRVLGYGAPRAAQASAVSLAQVLPLREGGSLLGPGPGPGTSPAVPRCFCDGRDSRAPNPEGANRKIRGFEAGVFLFLEGESSPDKLESPNFSTSICLVVQIFTIVLLSYAYWVYQFVRRHQALCNKPSGISNSSVRWPRVRSMLHRYTALT